MADELVSGLLEKQDLRVVVAVCTQTSREARRLHALHIVRAQGHVVGGAVLAGHARQARAAGRGEGLARGFVVGPAEDAEAGEVVGVGMHWAG